MADVILDQRRRDRNPSGSTGNRWRKSALIDGAYEAEGFFPHLGEGGKWCWFTAAPIKSPDGRIVGRDRDPLGQDRGQARRAGARAAHGGAERHGLHLLGPERPGGPGGAHPAGHGRAPAADGRGRHLHLPAGRRTAATT
ncbi:MAG: hypothetical protein MZV70_52545 [Desulfobacterales bacterium]|nr:hypothetical protein [Desulfobacterales bacterium]